MIRKNNQVRQIKCKNQTLTQLLELKKKCDICYNKQQISQRMHKILYEKHSSNQNYNYINDVKDIIYKKVNHDAINFRFFESFDEEREFLKIFYEKPNIDHKLKLLGNYYKFHNDIPRIFISAFMNIFNQFHNVKRRIYYNIVTAQLKKQQNQQNQNEQEIKVIKKDFPKKIDNPVLINVSVVKKFEPSIIIQDFNNQSQNTTNIMDYFNLKPNQSNIDETQIYEQNKSFDKLHSFLEYMQNVKQISYKPQLKLDLRRPQSYKPQQYLNSNSQQVNGVQNYVLYSQKSQNLKYIDIRKQQQQHHLQVQQTNISQKSFQQDSKIKNESKNSINQQILIPKELIHNKQLNINHSNQNIIIETSNSNDNYQTNKQQSIIRQNIIQKQQEKLVHKELLNKNSLILQSNVRSSLQDYKQMIKQEEEKQKLSLSSEKQKKKSTFVEQSPVKQNQKPFQNDLSKRDNNSLLTISNNNLTTNNQTQQSQFVQQVKNTVQPYKLIGTNKVQQSSSLKMIQDQKFNEKQRILSGQSNSVRKNSASLNKMDATKSQRVVIPPSKQQIKDNLIQTQVSSFNKTHSLVRTNYKSLQSKQIGQLYLNYAKNQNQSHQITKSVSNLQLSKIQEQSLKSLRINQINEDQQGEQLEDQELRQEKHHMKSKSDQIQIIRKNQFQVQEISPYIQVQKSQDFKNVYVRKKNSENLKSSQSVKKILQVQDGSFKFLYNKNL